MYKYLLILALWSFGLLAQTSSPPNFPFKSGEAVFVDFQDVKYKIQIDFLKKTSTILASVTFHQDKAGYPIFDLRTKYKSIKLDKAPASASHVTPPGSETTLRVVNEIAEPGTHTLEVLSDVAEFRGGINFAEGRVDFGFGLSGMTDREFFEIWSATNLEYDQYPSEVEFQLLNAKEEHKLHHNGEEIFLKKNHFKVAFPSYFNTSAIFLHLVPEGTFRETSFTIPSISGRDIPVTIFTDEPYTSNDLLERGKAVTLKVVPELEAKIGAWPHPRLLIELFEGSSGMEYHGATISGIEDLRHEIIHSYFARGIMPLDGRSSWIDESITEWITHEYKGLAVPCAPAKSCSLKLNELPPYIRHTTVTYSHGEAFISYLNQKFEKKGGMLAFLPLFFEKYKFGFITTEIFKAELEEFFQEDLTRDFELYVYN